LRSCDLKSRRCAKLPNWHPVIPLHDADGTVNLPDPDDGHPHHYAPSSLVTDLRAEIAVWKSRAEDYYRIGKHWADLVDTLLSEIAELKRVPRGVGPAGGQPLATPAGGGSDELALSSAKTHCPSCHRHWDEHEFGVPAPTCPQIVPALSLEVALACRCAQIQADDPRRHFKGCPKREELPEMAPSSEASADLTELRLEITALRAERDVARAVSWDMQMHNATLRKSLEVRTEYHTFVQQRDEARLKATEASVILRELVNTLPRCKECGKPATRARYLGSGPPCCDEHGVDAPEYPRGAAVRKAIALREKEGR
jgi:hypothetical protein